MNNPKLNEMFRMRMRSYGINPDTKKVEDKELYKRYLKESGFEEFFEDEFDASTGSS